PRWLGWNDRMRSRNQTGSGRLSRWNYRTRGEATMERGKQFLTSIFGHDEEAALSRRDALAGLGLGALLVATAKFVAPSPAEGKPLDKAADAAASSAPERKPAETQVAEVSDATDLTSRRHWR